MTSNQQGPAYLRVAETLRAQITAGEFAPGDPLPAEPKLAEQHGVSSGTARDALRQLRSWGLAEARRGAGTFVRRPPDRVRRDATSRYRVEKMRAQWPEDQRRELGATELDTGKQLDRERFSAEFDQIEAPADLAALFELPAGTPLLRRRYGQVAEDGQRWTASTSYLPYELAAKNPDLLDPEREPWPGGTQHQLRTVGEELSRIVDHVTARAPLPEEAAALELDHGSAVFAVRKLSYNRVGVIVEVADLVLPAERTELVYTVELPDWL